MKKILLISGKARSGKSTTSDAVIGDFGGTRISFATTLKEGSQPIIDNFGLDLTNPIEKEIARPILQTVGQVGRALSPNYGVEKAFEEIENSDDELFLIDDLRFPNELKFFKEELDDSEYEVVSVRLEDTNNILGLDDKDISEIAFDDKLHMFDHVFTARQDDTIPNVLAVVTSLHPNGFKGETIPIK